MTESLTARLQQRLSSQTAEIEALTSAELTRLASSLRQQSEAALRTMHSDILDTSMMVADELEIIRWTARWWWVALIVTWLMVGVLSVWLSWTAAPSTAGIELYQTFTQEGRTYLMLPEGVEPMVCREGEKTMPCMALPVEN